jgi:hypothetical protein
VRGFFKGKKLLPKAFTEHIDDIKGIYVPFWLFDGESDAAMRFRGTKTRTFTQGEYKVTETSHFRVERKGNVAFEKVPADASTKMPDEYMDSVEPYNYKDLKPFSTAFLPGFLADKYDQTAEQCVPRVNARIKQSTERAFMATITGYNTLKQEFCSIRLKRGQVLYALLPVWLLSVPWGGKSYLFAMNGQTGKLAGELPVDMGKFWRWFFTIFLPPAAILAALIHFVWGV